MQNTILVVDDDHEIRESLCRVLQDEGYLAVGVSNGHEALSYLRVDPRPSAVVLDLVMPVMSGWEFLRVRQADERLASIPVVVFSAVAGQNVLSLEGVATLLEKPSSLRNLLQAVNDHCEVRFERQ